MTLNENLIDEIDNVLHLYIVDLLHRLEHLFDLLVLFGAGIHVVKNLAH